MTSKKRPLHEKIRDAMERQFADLAYFSPIPGERELCQMLGVSRPTVRKALELLEAEPVSIGDYILTGGELACLVMMDAISRLVPGVLNKEASHEIESFSDGLLEYPQYSRPENYEGMSVPEELLSKNKRRS